MSSESSATTPRSWGDDDDGRAELLLQIPDQVQDLRLDRHVERRGGLVGDQQLGVVDQRHRDHRALPHPAGELVRVAVDPLAGLGDAHPVQQLDRAPAGRLLVDVVVDAVRLHDLVAHREEGVQRRERVLEDHGDLAAPQLAHRLRVGGEQLLAVQPDLARELRALPAVLADRVQAHDAERGDGLAGARLADDAEGLALLQREGEPVDGLDQAVRPGWGSAPAGRAPPGRRTGAAGPARVRRARCRNRSGPLPCPARGSRPRQRRRAAAAGGASARVASGPVSVSLWDLCSWSVIPASLVGRSRRTAGPR